MPETSVNRNVEKVFAVLLRTFLQIGLTHDPEKNLAVDRVKAGYFFHFRRRSVLFCRNFFDHVFPHATVHAFSGHFLFAQSFKKSNARKNGFRKRFHLIFRFVFRFRNQRAELFILFSEQKIALVFPELFL